MQGSYLTYNLMDRCASTVFVARSTEEGSSTCQNLVACTVREHTHQTTTTSLLFLLFEEFGCHPNILTGISSTQKPRKPWILDYMSIRTQGQTSSRLYACVAHSSGSPMAASPGGHSRKCSSSGSNEYPRLDTAVIMLVTCGEYCLLGRKPEWPQDRWGGTQRHVGKLAFEGSSSNMRRSVRQTTSPLVLQYPRENRQAEVLLRLKDAGLLWWRSKWCSITLHACFAE